MVTRPEIGLHDEAGGAWLKDKGLQGWCLPVINLGTTGRPLDFRHFEDSGIRVIVRLNYDFNPSGTLPDPEDATEGKKFVEAVLQTMGSSQGISGYVLGNEPNNPWEFPHGKPIFADYYADIYNQVWKHKPGGANLAPAATDPYFGPPAGPSVLPYEADNRVWWRKMVAQIDGADFFTIHCKTQDSNPDNISSDAKFTDDPLKWQFLHIRAYQPLLEAIPAHLRPRAVHATEVNPQRHNDMVTLGWQHDQGPKWVSKVIEHFHDWNVAHAGGLEVNSVIFYRFSGDQWALNPNHQNILDAIRDEIKKG